MPKKVIQVKIHPILSEREAVTVALGMGATYAAAVATGQPTLAARLRKRLSRQAAESFRGQVFGVSYCHPWPPFTGGPNVAIPEFVQAAWQPVAC